MQEGGVRRGMKAHLPIWRRLGWRLAASFLLLTALGILLSGLLQYRAQQRWVRESLGSLLLNIARTGALVVDGDLHARVVTEGRTDTPAYESIRATLQQIKDTNELGDPVYTLANAEGDMARFAVISHGQEPVGKQYRLAPAIQPVLARVFSEGTAAFTDIYTNEHGTWITAFAPIRNAAGQTVAALDVDFRADVYLEQLADVQRRLYLHSLAGAMLALIAGVILARQITRPVGQLSAMARRVVEGDLTTQERITSRDEIGLLGLGEADLVAALGMEPSPDRRELTPIRVQLVVVSAATGIGAPIAPVSTHLDDLEGLERSTIELRRMGFGARTAIHPAQVPVINRVFTPEAKEVEQARRLLERAEEAASIGASNFVDDDGRFVDEAVLRSARRYLMLAEEYGIR